MYELRVFHTGLRVILKCSQFLFSALFQDEQHVSLVQVVHVDQGICLHLHFHFILSMKFSSCWNDSLCLLFQHGHGYLTENLGIPVWGSYALFGLATLFLGMVLGLVSEVLGAVCALFYTRAASPSVLGWVFGVPWAGTQWWGAGWSPRNPRGNGHNQVWGWMGSTGG